ncbi:MAG: ABC transporter permease, partial [Anaerolineae bacterium]
MREQKPVSRFAFHVSRVLIRRAPLLLYALPIAFLTIFFFYPLFEIFKLSFAPDGQLSFGSLQKLISSSYYLKTLWFTIWQATVSTLLTVLLAMPGAYVFARYRFPGKSLIQALTTIPFVLPSIVVAAAFTALLGPRGWVNTALMALFGLDRPPINLQFTIWMILLAHVFYNYTVVLRIVGGFWANLSPRLEEAAAVLGAGRRQVFREVTLPLLLPAITAASLLVFIFDFTSFGVILILGGPRYATLEVAIYRQAVNLFNLPVAAALSLAQIVFTLSLMWVYTRLQARTTVPLDLQARRQLQRPPAAPREKWLVWGNVVVMLGLLLTPLLALVARSFSPGGDGWTLQFYRELFINRRRSILFVPPVEAVRNSVGFAGATTLLALLLGLIGAYLLVRRRGQPFDRLRTGISSVLDPIFMLPLGTSAVTLGFGFIIALDEPPLNLRTSPLLIPLA